MTPDPKVSELLPCPMCGCNAEYDNSDSGSEWIVCIGCGVGTSLYSMRRDQGKCYAAWNRRTAASADAWRPISSAPKDRCILLYSPVHGIVEGSWEQVDGGGHPENGPPVYWWVTPHCEFIDGPYDAPTHWMHRPADPAAMEAPHDHT